MSSKVAEQAHVDYTKKESRILKLFRFDEKFNKITRAFILLSITPSLRIVKDTKPITLS